MQPQRLDGVARTRREGHPRDPLFGAMLQGMADRRPKLRGVLIIVPIGVELQDVLTNPARSPALTLRPRCEGASCFVGSGLKRLRLNWGEIDPGNGAALILLREEETIAQAIRADSPGCFHEGATDGSVDDLANQLMREHMAAPCGPPAPDEPEALLEACPDCGAKFKDPEAMFSHACQS